MNKDRARRTLILISVALSFALSAGAQPNRWIPISPGHGFDTTAIAVDPDRSATIFLGTEKGEILRTNDGGSSWRSVHLEPGSFAVSALAIAPAPGSVIFAVFTTSTFTTTLIERSRVLRSFNGGDTWEPATNGLRNLPVRAISIDPFDSFRVYAGAIGGVFRSDDRGRTWTDASDGLSDRNVQALVADPSVPGTLYAGAAHMFIPQSGGLFRTTDGGIHWSDVSGSLPPPGQTILQVRALAAGASPRTLYASVRRLTFNLGAYYEEESAFRSTDGGNTWSPAGLPSSPSIVTDLVVNPAVATTVYASEAGPAILWRSTDGGTTWTSVSGAVYRPVAIDPNSESTIYAPSASLTGLIAKSENGGAAWTDLANGLRSPTVNAVAADSRMPTTVYCGTEGHGVFKSADGGATWRPVTNGLGDLQILTLTNAPWSAPVLFAVTGNQKIYRSTDGAETWTLASGGLPTSGGVVALTPDPDSFGTLYVAIQGFGVFKTTNLGDSWTLSNNGPNLGVRSIAVDPNRPGVVYLATSSGLFKSTTGGASWESSGNGLNERFPNVLAIDPVDSLVLYVSTTRLEPYRGGPAMFEVHDVVYRSVDGGASWTALGPATYATRHAVVDPRSGVVYLSAFAGVIRSRDRGITWEALKEGLPQGYFNLAVDGATPPTVYAANGSLFRLTLAAADRLCVPSPTALCLNRGRFRVEASFNARNLPADGSASTIPLTADSGAFWFFSPQNVEVVVKVVDGTSFNERFWVFVAGLSDVEYTLTVTDTAEGAVRTYFNPSGRLASLTDAGAFPVGVSGSTTSPPSLTSVPKVEQAGCESDPTSLCLNGGRFRVSATFRVPSQNQDGTAMAVPWTTDTGYFWFFSPGNIELVVKVLDGREVNGSFWVFYAGLTDLETTISVTDTVTGVSRTYLSPAGSAVSAADTSAF